MIFKELPSFETLLESSERYPEMDVKVCVAWIHIVHAGAILQRRIEGNRLVPMCRIGGLSDGR